MKRLLLAGASPAKMGGFQHFDCLVLKHYPDLCPPPLRSVSRHLPNSPLDSSILPNRISTPRLPNTLWLSDSSQHNQINIIPPKAAATAGKDNGAKRLKGLELLLGCVKSNTNTIEIDYEEFMKHNNAPTRPAA